MTWFQWQRYCIRFWWRTLGMSRGERARLRIKEMQERWCDGDKEKNCD